MSVKTYLLHCQYCGYKRLTDGSDVKDLIEVKTSPIMTSIPVLDPATGKTIAAKFKDQKKRFKCPKCGRIVFPKNLKGKWNEQDNDTGHQRGDEGPEIQGKSPS
jgi:DNA-directed RNA polymerase subunit RPC12/RpoP